MKLSNGVGDCRSLGLHISQKFTKEEVYSRDLLKLDIKWMDLGEKDDRTIGELLGDMQTKASAIAEAVAKLQDLLGGIEL